MRFAFVIAMMLIATPAFAQSPPPQTAPQGGPLGDLADIVFKEAEKRAIEEYYKRVPGARPDGEEAEKDDDEDSERKDKTKKGKDKDKAKGKGRGSGLPPGLAKRDQLPPGLAKRGNRLPPGLQKSDLPPELEKRLDTPPENTERVVVDEDVLLVEKGTGVILDVLEGVIRGQ